jgi:hypothetical protein
MWQCLLYISAISFLYSYDMKGFYQSSNLQMCVRMYICLSVCMCVYINTMQASSCHLIMKLSKDILQRVTILQLLRAKIPLSVSERCKTCTFCATLSGWYQSNLKVISWASLNTVRCQEHILVYLLNSYTELIFSGNFVPFPTSLIKFWLQFLLLTFV